MIYKNYKATIYREVAIDATLDYLNHIPGGADAVALAAIDAVFDQDGAVVIDGISCRVSKLEGTDWEEV